MSNNTPLESFINHKAQTGMQCGNYSIDVPELKEGNSTVSTLMQRLVLGVTVVRLRVMSFKTTLLM